MVTLWIGDFRTKQLQTLYSSAQQTAEYHYLVEESAQYTWFKNNVVTQLCGKTLDTINVIVMLGLNDCIHSCIWDSFKIEEIAKQYANDISILAATYPSLSLIHISEPTRP